MKNIFDLSNIDDLPENMQTDVNSGSFENRILCLFRIAKRKLNVDEVTVAYYRKFRKIKTRKQMATKLYNMTRAKSPKIKKSFKEKRGLQNTNLMFL